MSEGDAKKQGTVKKIVSDRGFGFISGDRGDVFFHFSSMGEGEFDELHEGQAVEYEIEHDGDAGRGGKGPRASSVRAV
jgi:CspA family cold shock protein